MKIEFQRGSSDIFIVNNNGKYYLVNVNRGTCSLANPPELPSMFLKFGYFEDVNDIYVKEATKEKVRQLIDNYKGENN